MKCPNVNVVATPRVSSRVWPPRPNADRFTAGSVVGSVAGSVARSVENHGSHPRLGRSLIICLCLLASLALPACAAAKGPVAQDPQHPDIDLWYALTLSGQRAGYAHITVHREGDRITTTNQTSMTVRRGGMVVPIEQESTFVETPAGKPIKTTSRLKSSLMAVNQTLKFTDQGMMLTTGAGQGAQTQKLPPIKGDWLTPYQAQLYQQKRVDARDKTFKLRTVDLSLGPKAHTMTFTRQTKPGGPDEVQAFGKTVPAVAYRGVVDSMSGNPVIQYFDERGNVVKQSIAAMPGMDVTMLLADKATATAQIDPPKLVAKTLIHPDKPITDPRDLRSATYQVTVAGKGKADIPQVAEQHVVYGTGRTAKLVVDLDNPVAPGPDTPTAADRDASTMVNSEDPHIQSLAKKAVADLPKSASDTDKAHAIRTFVHDYMTEKNLSVGFATASEAARTRQGDCTEHAVLLAAMLRAAGIPARTASGLLYADQFLDQRGIFGYHMWAQAWLEGHWTGLDAILPNGEPFDAAHILLSTSSMSDAGYQNDMFKLMPLLGTLKIKVVSTSTH